MRNQFFYRRIQKSGDRVYTFLDSFNMDSVIRGVQQVDGTFLILLNDGHEESIVTQQASKNTPERRERKWYDSQITLTKEDRIRFQLLTSIDDPLADVPVVVLPPPPTTAPEVLEPEEKNGALADL